MAETRTPIISFKNFSFQYRAQKQPTLHDIDLDIYPGERVLIAGPSGSGKSTLAACINGLNPFSYPGECTGTLTVDGVDAPHSSIFELAGHVGTVLQDPDGQFIGLTVGEDIAFALENSCTPQDEMHEITRRAAELVGIENHLDYAPHELSGGQRQRVLIAMALTRDPKLVICDEPTTALDVTVQKQVIKLLNDLQAKLGFAMIFVSHDLALVAEVAHNITVMYAGQVIEQAPTKELLTNPIHEYTRGLLGSVLSIESGSGRLHQVPGAVPSPRDFPKGDRFAPRSSHPRIGLDTRPVFKRVPGTEHFYSELPDEVLKANGLTPHAEVM